jgi:small subunit ribosomal protein S6
MTVRLYETLFLLDSTKVATDGDGSRNQVHALLEKHGGEILVSRPWDENRKLAYPIKKQKKGYYYAVYYKVNTAKLIDMERDFAINEVILRQLTSVIEPKWEEAIMEVARNDHSPAFSLRSMQDEAAPTDITPNLPGSPPAEANGAAGDRPRVPRGPRREMAEKPE